MVQRESRVVGGQERRPGRPTDAGPQGLFTVLCNFLSLIHSFLASKVNIKKNQTNPPWVLMRIE
jgi:hypothetical protein